MDTIMKNAVDMVTRFNQCQLIIIDIPTSDFNCFREKTYLSKVILGNVIN